MKEIKLRDAIKKMRAQSELNIPFSFSFVSLNQSTQSSNGLKTVNEALLRTGYRDDQSDKSNILIAYYDCTQMDDKARQFYLPLLMTYNDYKVIP
jgi:hypothetical protein